MVDEASFSDIIYRYRQLVPESKQSHVTCMRLHDKGGIFCLYDMLTTWNASGQANGIYIAVMKAGG